MVEKKDSYLYIFISVTFFFVIVNLLTITWSPLPWFDEVWFVDTAVNFSQNGEWKTTAQLSFGGESPIALYPPLYQYCLSAWLWFTGFSIVSVRSFNLFIVAIASWVLSRTLLDMNLIKNKSTLFLFLLLFWGTGMFAWSYRNGRPDMLNMLFSLFFVRAYFQYVTENKRQWLLLLWTVLVLFSGLQACPFIFIFLIYCLFVYKTERKKTVFALGLYGIGICVGLLLLWTHFSLLEHPKSFFWQFSQSESLSKLLYKIPFLKDSIEISNLSSFSLIEKIIESYVTNKNYLILTGVNSFLFLFYWKRIARIVFAKFCFVFSLIIPFFMALFGHIMSFYTWMYYLPALVFMLCIISEIKKQIFVYWGIAIFFTIILGLTRTLITADRKAYDRISEFIDRQQFDSNSKILSGYKPYYQLRSITNKAYYSVYPMEWLPEDIEYVLETTDEHHSENLEKYLRLKQSEGKTIFKMDSINSPRMILYHIE